MVIYFILFLMVSVKVTPEDVRKLNLPPECVNKTPSGEIFVKSSLQKVNFFIVMWLSVFPICKHEWTLVVVKFSWIL